MKTRVIGKNWKVLCLLCWFVLLSCASAGYAQVDRTARVSSLVYLGDMHFDRMSHHDLDWVRATKPNDMRQIEGYVRNTKEYTPKLLQRIQTSIASHDSQIQMIIQGGDLTEGLCGSQTLQETQFRDTLACIRQYIPETPFLMVKGNHDVTGPGAREAFDKVMLPWLSSQCGKAVEFASFFVMKGPDLYVFFDAYHHKELVWLKKTLSENPHRYAFVVMHLPAVPYTARSTWHVFSRENEADRRFELLNILGTHRVILLTAHLHKYHVLARKTPTGRFVQVSMSSVIHSPEVSVKNAMEGVGQYGRSLVELEPAFQPETKVQRQQILDREKPSITHFDYAEFPGYAMIHVSDEGVDFESYLGHSDRVWKSVSLSDLLE